MRIFILAAALIVAAANASTQDAGVTMQRVRLNTGVALQVALSGRQDGDPVLFLHGFTDSWFSYSEVLKRLPASIRAIVPSQRGHGDSERPTCCYRIETFAADAVAVLDAMGVKRATVVGHSMGSLVAQRVATDFPDRVNRLVLIGTGKNSASAPVMELNAAVQKLTDPIDPAFIREFQQSTLAKPVPPAFFETVIDEAEKLPARVWRDVLAGLVAPDALRPADRIQAATLIVWGDKDGVWNRAEQDQLNSSIRGSRLAVYENTGHSPQWEDPARFTTDFLDFIGTRVTSNARPEQQHQHDAQGHTHHQDGPMQLLAGLGDWHHRITTRSPEAQKFFDQGLRLTYAFNHEEAVRSFERATELDAECAMCYWGIAYGLGPNINLPMDPAIEPRALAAIQRAVTLKPATMPLEQALIDAMALRFGNPAGAARAERDLAYANAMRNVAQRFADDVDTQVLFADAMLNLRPWNQWKRDGTPQPGTLELVAALDRALKREPQHAGGCHFYIHSVEASQTPERALPCAERLPRLMPGAGHVVHMPAHIYMRVGRYEDAARANIAAVEADNSYLSRPETRDGFYPLFYAPHNLHFLWSTYTLSGQRVKANNAARALVQRVSPDAAQQIVALQGFMPSAFLTLVRFGDADAVLAEPAPPAELKYVRGMWHYARGMALAAQQDFESATAEHAKLRTIAGQVTDDMIILLNSAPSLLNLASEVLQGEIAARQTRFDAAVAHLRKAIEMEDALTYDEPPSWYHPVRNMLGEVLLAAGRAGEAEAAFRDDLRVVRDTGWSLSGLERSLKAQGKTREATEAAQRLREAWKYADAPPAPAARVTR